MRRGSRSGLVPYGRGQANRERREALPERAPSREAAPERAGKPAGEFKPAGVERRIGQACLDPEMHPVLVRSYGHSYWLLNLFFAIAP